MLLAYIILWVPRRLETLGARAARTIGPAADADAGAGRERGGARTGRVCVGDDGAGKLVAADVGEGQGQAGHLAGGQDGVGVAVRGGVDTDEDVVGPRRHRHGGVVHQVVRLVVGVQLLRLHVGGDGHCHVYFWCCLFFI